MGYCSQGGGALPYKPIRDVPFFGVSFFSVNSWTRYEIDQKFRNGLWLFVQEQKAIVFKNNRLLFFLLFSHCFVIQKFRNRVSKCKHFPKRVVVTLKKWAPPRQVTFKCPPPGVPLLPSSRPIIKLQIWFHSVFLKAVVSGASYTTVSQNFLWTMNTAQENELYLYIKIQYYVTSLKSWYPTAKFKKYQENATVGGGFNSIREGL